MKKILTVFMAFIMILSMAACGNDDVVEPADEIVSPNDFVVDVEATAPIETVVPTEEPTEPHDHNYSEKMVLPTCDDRGYTEFACDCGDVYQDYFVDEVGHDWSAWETVEEPTEKTGGKGKRTCARCGVVENRELPKLAVDHTHNYSITMTKAATCSETGTKVWTCTRCDYSYEEVVAKLTHDYKNTIVEPTCTKKGYTTHECVDCGHSYKDTYVDANGHDYKSEITEAATCSKVGQKKYSCSCGASYVEEIAKIDHVYTKSIVEPSCTERGYTAYKCKCGDTYNDNYIDAVGHDWSEWKTTKEPTEKKEGSAERICSLCDKKDTKSLPKVDKEHTHSYEENITKNATCSTEGTKTFKCSCGDSYTESIPKLTHNYSSNVVAPTCANKGYTEHKCLNCGDSYKDNYTNIVDHSYNAATTKEPSCVEEGVKTYTCSGCKNQYTEVIAKINHNYADTVANPTCTNGGYTTYKCSGCGRSYDGDKTDALGHDYVDNVIAPTCTKDGYTKHECSRCAVSYSDTPTTATGHNYQFTSDTATCTADGVRTETCQNCGDKKTKKTTATGHVNTTTIIVDANCVDDGYKKVTCDACGAELSNEVIPSDGTHTFVTKRVPTAVQEFTDYWGSYEYTDWAKYKEWNVQACADCKEIDLDTMTFMYSDYEAASIMLGYVNKLREEYFGTSEYNLTLDSGLISTAKGRAIQISSNFGHIGIPENIHRGSYSIYGQFQAWLNSSAHKENMLSQDYTRFGYGIYVPDPVNFSDGYGAQVFG